MIYKNRKLANVSLRMISMDDVLVELFNDEDNFFLTTFFELHIVRKNKWTQSFRFSSIYELINGYRFLLSSKIFFEIRQTTSVVAKYSSFVK